MEAPGRTNFDRIREYGQALQRDPDTLAFALLADVFREEGMLPEALDVCRQGLERHPDYVAARIVMGQVYEEMDEIGQAAAEYETALRLDPGNLVARTALGGILLHQGDVEAAKAQIDHVLFANPMHQQARELLDIAEGRRPMPARGRKAAPTAPAAEGAPPAAEPETVAAPGIEASIAMLARAEGVTGVMALAEDGLVIASELGLEADEDAFAALLAQIHGSMRRYAARLSMGRLRRAVVDGAGGMLILAAAGGAILVVTTEADAKLGMVNMQIDRAVALLEPA